MLDARCCLVCGDGEHRVVECCSASVACGGIFAEGEWVAVAVLCGIHCVWSGSDGRAIGVEGECGCIWVGGDDGHFVMYAIGLNQEVLICEDVSVIVR